METKKDIDLNIVTTDKLLYGMVKNIVGDRHLVEYMFKNRDRELSFQFSEDSLNNIAKKDLFIYMGADLEPWINDFIDKLNKNRVGVINVSRGVKLLSYNKVVKYKDITLKDNPYYLSNLDNYKIALMNIKNAIQDRDPKNRDIYEKNFSQALKNLENYQKDLKSACDNLTEFTFVVVEDELSYFVKYNNFKTLDINRDKDTVRIMPVDKTARLDIESKLKDNKKLVILYNSDEVLKNNEDIIKSYNIKAVNIKTYSIDTSYEDVLKGNIERLKAFYDKESVVK
jgi:ABC-type metal ion transport system, periplasmic component/surface adhesin